MPNWVYGDLNITGDKESLLKFKEYAKGDVKYDEEEGEPQKKVTELDMNKFIPYPKEFNDIDKRNKEYHEKFDRVKEKLKNKEMLTYEDEKLINELALIELEGENKDYDTDGYNSGGYDWCIRNWGTKWNFCDVFLDDGEQDKEVLHYNFQTAWAIPIPVLLEMSNKFANLTFNYYGNEESEEFEVEFQFKAGQMEVISEKNWEQIQIEKIEEGNVDGFDYDEELYNELKKHTGHKIIKENSEFKCQTCENKSIWSIDK